MQTPEGRAGAHVDQQLTAADWAVHGVNELHLSAQRGVAVREFTTALGPADYLPFADGMAIGVMQANEKGTTLSVLFNQACEYGTAKTKSLPKLKPAPTPSTTSKPNSTAKSTTQTASANPLSDLSFLANSPIHQ